MGKKLRLQDAGAIYHLLSRGNRRDQIFLHDVDRHDFIKTLADACQTTGWRGRRYDAGRRGLNRDAVA